MAQIIVICQFLIWGKTGVINNERSDHGFSQAELIGKLGVIFIVLGLNVK